MLYDGKISTGDEAAECVEQLRKRMETIGCCIVTDGEIIKNKRTGCFRAAEGGLMYNPKSTKATEFIDHQEILDSLEKGSQETAEKRKTIDKSVRRSKALPQKKRRLQNSWKNGSRKRKNAQKAIRSFLKSVMSCLADQSSGQRMLPTEDSGRKDRREPGSKEFPICGKNTRSLRIMPCSTGKKK